MAGSRTVAASDIGLAEREELAAAAGMAIGFIGVIASCADEVIEPAIDVFEEGGAGAAVLPLPGATGVSR